MNAQQITPRVRRWLRNSGSARVLHLFPEACSLSNDRGEVIALVSPEIGPGPFHAVMGGDFTAGLAIDQPVTLDAAGQFLTVGPLRVDCRESPVWRPKPEWTRLRRADFGEWPSPSGLPDDITHYLSRVIDGLMADDLSLYGDGVAGLAGRGSGLTPAGDDVLMGVLHALWAWYPNHPRRPRREWLGIILSTAVPRTATLSANFLRAAAAGEATWHWHDLADGRPGAADRILSIGHSSGADAWAGFVQTGGGLCRQEWARRGGENGARC